MACTYPVVDTGGDFERLSSGIAGAIPQDNRSVNYLIVRPWSMDVS